MSTSTPTVLVIDDEPAIINLCIRALEGSHTLVQAAYDAHAGLDAALRPGIDLVLLDLNLHDHDGHRVLKALTRQTPQLPVVILSADGSQTSRDLALAEGAVHFLTKPFALTDLLAVVHKYLIPLTN